MLAGGLSMSAWFTHNGLDVRWAAVLAAALIAAVCDVRTRRIPNALTGITLMGGLAWAIHSGGAWGLGASLTACAMMAAPFIVLFVVDSSGGGAADAKLMGAIGAWLGIGQGLVVLATVLIVGAALSLGYATVKGQLRPVLSNLQMMTGAMACGVTRRISLREVRGAMPSPQRLHVVPYGVSILCGVAWAAMMMR
jgi:prepilin peptidase CpaA